MLVVLCQVQLRSSVSDAAKGEQLWSQSAEFKQMD